MIELAATYGKQNWALLGDLCDIRGGFPAPQDDAAFENGDIPFVRMRDVGRFHFTNKLTETDQALNRTHFAQGRYELTPAGSILMPRSGSVGLNHRAILRRDAVIVSHLCALVPKSTAVDVGYLYRYLCVVDMRKFTKKTTGLDSISFSDLKKVRIPLPSLPDQRRIADILDRADALRAERRAALALLDTLTRVIFIEMFGDPMMNPKGWVTSDLQEACSEINDCPHSTPVWTEEGVVCLRTSNLTDGGWNWDDTRHVTEASYDTRSKRGRLEPGDIVLSREGTVGVAAIVQPGMRACMGQRLVQVRPSPSVLVPEFLLQQLLHMLSPSRIRQVMVGSTSQHLNVKELRALRVPQPNLTIQHAFARRAAAVENLKSAHRASLAKLDELFAALQHRAFRGEL